MTTSVDPPSLGGPLSETEILLALGLPARLNQWVLGLVHLAASALVGEVLQPAPPPDAAPCSEGDSLQRLCLDWRCGGNGKVQQAIQQAVDAALAEIVAHSRELFPPHQIVLPEATLACLDTAHGECELRVHFEFYKLPRQTV